MHRKNLTVTLSSARFWKSVASFVKMGSAVVPQFKIWDKKIHILFELEYLKYLKSTLFCRQSLWCVLKEDLNTLKVQQKSEQTYTLPDTPAHFDIRIIIPPNVTCSWEHL